MENLAKTIKELNTNPDYDCLLMFSGGKDSSYLLYYLSEELGLRVVTVTLTHNFLAKETLENIENFASKYSKKHINIQNNHLNHAGTHFLENWINKPDEGSLINLCTGCRLGLVDLIIETAKKEKMNVVLTANTPFEATDYRTKLVHYPVGKDGKIYFLFGYLRLLLRNPSLLSNFKAVRILFREYYSHTNRKKIFKKNGLHRILPFYYFLKYDEQQVIETLKKLGWQKASISTKSYWRADCNMNAIRQFFHSYISGYNELEMYYGKMLTENSISKEYFEQNTQNNFKKEDILGILKSSGISEMAYQKYEKFLAGK
jgi:tRNA(Ile)-lysidine synthase TilS/MesJ